LFVFDDTNIERISVTVKPFGNFFSKKTGFLFFITCCDIVVYGIKVILKNKNNYKELCYNFLIELVDFKNVFFSSKTFFQKNNNIVYLFPFILKE